MLNLTPFLKNYSKKRLNYLDKTYPYVLQQNTFLNLLQKSQNTQFGIDHDFKSIRTISDYQERVPVRKYEQFWEEYWKPKFPVLDNITYPGKIPYFPVSSGTSSGTTKYIPLTKEMLKSNTKAGLDMLSYHIANKPDSKIFGGLSFMLGGSTDLVKEGNGIYSGDLSGITVAELPFWARARYFPSKKQALIADWEKKIDILGTESLKKDIRMISGVPSWLLIFFDKLAEKLGKDRVRVKDFYPNLEMVVHGGVSFNQYRKRFLEILEGSNAELREVYPASEGFIAVADRGYGEGLRLILDHGIFYEFIPVEELEKPNPTRHIVKNLVLGQEYAIVLTTCAGLWSYLIGDTVKFIDVETPRLLVTGRTSYYLSSFGEHLTGEEVDCAVSHAAEKINRKVTDYSVGTVFPKQQGELGGHLYVVEFSPSEISKKEEEIFLTELDSKLLLLNDDYKGHRAEGFGLNTPKLKIMPSGGFAEWMKSRGKLGGQNKVPRIVSNQEIFESLVRF